MSTMKTAEKKILGLGGMTKQKHQIHDADGGSAWFKKRRAALVKKKANHLRNRGIRAALYSEFQGETNRTSAEKWHGTLKSLSLGTV